MPGRRSKLPCRDRACAANPGSRDCTARGVAQHLAQFGDMPSIVRPAEHEGQRGAQRCALTASLVAGAAQGSRAWAEGNLLRPAAGRGAGERRPCGASVSADFTAQREAGKPRCAS